MPNANELDQLADGELLQQAVNGDEAAFVALYRRRQSGVYRFALRMCGSTTVAEDVTQEVFMALIRDGGRYETGRSTLTSYLFGIARNQVLRRLERERNFTPLPGDEAENALPGYLVAVENPLGDLTRQETIESVRQAVLALPPHYREAVVLCDLHELSYLAAAEVLGCAVGTVRSRLHRGRALLCERLKALVPAPSVATNCVDTNERQSPEVCVFGLKAQTSVSPS